MIEDLQAREAAERLGRLLQARHGFQPFEASLALAAGGLFDALLVRSQGEDLHVIALLGARDASAELALRAEALRKALNATRSGLGRVHASVWLLTTPEQARELPAFEDGHFLSRVLVARGLMASDGSVWEQQGQARTQPAGAELAALLNEGQDPGLESVARLQAERWEEERQSRRLLKPGRTPLTWTLVGLNIAAFFLQLLSEKHYLDAGMTLEQARLQSLLALGANFKELTLGPQPWRVLSSAFMHGDLIHLGFNMAALFSIGGLVERMAGPWRTLGLYLLSAVLAGFLSAVFLSAQVPSVGASGAILGLAGLLLAPHWKRDLGFPQELADRLYAWLAKPILWILVLGLGLYLTRLPLQLDNAAHIGGLCTGFGLGYLYPSFLVRPAAGKIRRQP